MNDDVIATSKAEASIHAPLAVIDLAGCARQTMGFRQLPSDAIEGNPHE